MLSHRFLVAFPLSSAAIFGPAAAAADSPIYGPPAAWVMPVDIAAAKAKGEPLVLFDRQARMEGGVVSNYSDIAYRIDSPETLTKGGTLQAAWMPDKGDLTIHRIEILRGSEVIDLVASGVRYTVLRRETALEKRSLDGALTAALAVPGLKVGDIVRFSQTITVRDQALGDAMQFSAVLPAAPAKVGLGRIAVSWPKDAPMAWRAGPKVALPAPVEVNGYKTLTIDLPIAKRDEAPANAPARFTFQPVVQVGSFTDWRDVSRRMAPHFATIGTILPGSAVAKEVAAIARAFTDPRLRAAAALRVVQEEIAYLVNGMDGGNYLPQKPTDTWGNRYGDCKAKSLLLLAMLRDLGIESEAVLVRSRDGDVVADLLPMPGDFDHMIVRAVIAGKDYWLDGTGLGARAETLEAVPNFAYALPLRPEGADLMPMEQRWPLVRDRSTAITYDYRAGLDMPVLYEATMQLRGMLGARVREQAGVTDPQARLEFAEVAMKDIVGDGTVYEASVSYDASSGIGIVKAKGLLGSAFTFKRGQGSLSLDLPATGLEFSPDRARAAWQAVPYATGGPFSHAEDVTVLLPADAGKMALTGLGTFDGEAAGVRVRRKATLAADRLHIVDEASWIPAEIPVADFPRQRAAVQRLVAGDPVLKTGAQPVRYWMLDPATARKRIAMLEPVYSAIVALEPEESWRWANRARLLQMGPDLKRALADWDKAIALEPTAQDLSSRSNLKKELGDLPGALADARAAFELEATSIYARSVADVLAQQGKTDEALAMLEGFDLSGDERIDLLMARADIMGEGGRSEAGWELLKEAEQERPGDAKVLNAQCWFMGNWSYRLDAATEVCNRAVTTGSYAAGYLDSRALVHYRLGKRSEAISDLQAALTAAPDQTTSLYLRGIIALEDGQKADGERDLAAATRLFGGIEAYFARFGIRPAK